MSALFEHHFGGLGWIEILDGDWRFSIRSTIDQDFGARRYVPTQRRSGAERAPSPAGYAGAPLEGTAPPGAHDEWSSLGAPNAESVDAMIFVPSEHFAA